MFICLMTLVLIPWNVLTPSTTKQRNFLTTIIEIKLPPFYKVAMMTTARLSAFVLSTTLSRCRSSWEVSPNFASHKAYGNLLHVINGAHITCQSHIVGSYKNNPLILFVILAYMNSTTT